MTGRALLVPDTPGAPPRHQPGPPSPPAAGTLWLVRHGQSGWNVAGRIQGQSPAAPGLTAAGREQAAGAARELARRAPRANLIVASDLTRTAETAEIIAAHLGFPVEFDHAVREQSLGDLEGHSAFVAHEAQGMDGTAGVSEGARPGVAAGASAMWASAAEASATGPSATGPNAVRGAGETDVLDAYWTDPFRKPPGGETVAEMYDRVHRALRWIAAAHPGADLIVVTHGGPVRVATAAHPPEPGHPFPRNDVGNASITPYRLPPPPSP